MGAGLGLDVPAPSLIILNNLTGDYATLNLYHRKRWQICLMSIYFPSLTIYIHFLDVLGWLGLLASPNSGIVEGKATLGGLESLFNSVEAGFRWIQYGARGSLTVAIFSPS